MHTSALVPDAFNGLDTSDPTPKPSSPLNVAIVGAGIAGLAAAIGLRKQGHNVHLYEQSEFVNEVGAAVHLCPNGNGVLRRWGIYAEEFGGTDFHWFKQVLHNGEAFLDADMTVPNKQWQHPWQFVHRVALHNRLKTAATDEGPGTPATLHTSSRVADVDAKNGFLVLKDGTVAKADAILGADGIYSRTRPFATGKPMPLFNSGKTAFRFLMPRSLGLSDPETKSLVDVDKRSYMWFAEDRRVVMYPCNDDKTLNFVLIHPEGETNALSTQDQDGTNPQLLQGAEDSPGLQGAKWNKTATMDQVLKPFLNFEPRLLKLVQKASLDELKVWPLLDMEKPPTWTNGRLTLLGDAAHPFLPYLGQGACVALEDAAALSVVLPLGTCPAEVPERLKLYERIRYERAHAIQDFTRRSGADWIDGKWTGNAAMFTNYNFGYDAHDYALSEYRKWLWQRNKGSLSWSMPVSFGPCDGRPGRQVNTQYGPEFKIATMRFQSSRTYLESLFPTKNFSFEKAATVCEASYVVTTVAGNALDQAYRSFGLRIHGVQYTKKDGTVSVGSFLPVLFENQSDRVTHSREELGIPSVFCDIVTKGRLGWFEFELPNRRPFATLELSVPSADKRDEATVAGEETEHDNLFAYRYIPAVGRPGEAESEYAVKACYRPGGSDSGLKVRRVMRYKDATMKFAEASSSPMHEALSLVPVYKLICAQVVEGVGDPSRATSEQVE